MTSEEFIEAFRTQTPLAFATTVSPLSEAQRKPLSKAAQQLLKEARDNERELRRPDVLMSLMANRTANMNVFQDRQGQVARAALAVLAVGPKSAAAKPVNWTDETSQTAVRILLDRRPEWADDWLEAQFQMRWGLFRFEEAMQLIRAGVCKRPTSVGYARLYAAAAVTLDHEAQPDLLEDLWLLFQHDVSTWQCAPKSKEINREQWMASARHQPGESYHGAYFRLIYHLLHKGRIDRQRLLDEILAALWRDFGNSSRAGLVKLHDLIEPTANERRARQPMYLELLQHATPAMVGFGLQILKQIQKDGHLDAPRFVDALPHVMSQKSKSQPTAALSLLKSVVKGRVDLLSTAIDVAASAIRHETSDVQEVALGLLETWVPQVSGDCLQSLADCSPAISPKLRERLETLLRPAESTASTPRPQTGKGLVHHLGEMDKTALRNRLTAIPHDVFEEYELQRALAAVERGEIPPPLDLDRSPYVLCDLQPVVPIRDLDELIDAVSRSVEVIETPLEVERILDAIGRLPTRALPNFRQRTEPLANRFTTQGSTFSMQPNLNWLSNEIPSLRGLIQDWLYQQSFVEVKNRMSDLFSGSWLTARRNRPASHVMEHRINEMRKQFSQQSPGPLLSLPTHEHGWIDARVFVRRLREHLQSGRAVGHCDLTWALLRLAPDGREEAINSSRELPDPFGRLIRYALGAAETITEGDQEWADAWIAAGRTRAPRGNLPELSRLKVPGVTNATEAMRYRLNWSLSPSGDASWTYYHDPNRHVVEVFPLPESSQEAAAFPTIAMAQQVIAPSHFGMSAILEEWLATSWPANSDCVLAIGADRLVLRMDAAGSMGLNLEQPLQVLRNTERSWSELGCVLLWLGLLSKDSTARAVARDALAGGRQDGRAHPASLAAALQELAPCSWVKLNRLAEGLRDVSRISHWAALVTSEILNSLMGQWRVASRDAHHLLELQINLLNELQVSLPESVKEVLSSWSGTGKSAKLARELCQLQFDHPTGRTAALWEALEIRIARAERVIEYRNRVATS